MCTGITEKAKITGSGKGPSGWLKLDKVHVSYDHPHHASLDHAVNVDFVNDADGFGTRVAIELSPESAVKLVHAIVRCLAKRVAMVSDELSGLEGASERWQEDANDRGRNPNEYGNNQCLPPANLVEYSKREQPAYSSDSGR